MLKRFALAGAVALTGYEVYSHFSAPQVQVPDTATAACSDQIHAAVLACAADPAAFNSHPQDPVEENLKNCLKANGVEVPIFNCSKPDSYAQAHLYVGGTHSR